MTAVAKEAAVIAVNRIFSDLVSEQPKITDAEAEAQPITDANNPDAKPTTESMELDV